MPFNGAGSNLSGASDVFLSNTASNDLLKYNTSTSKWNNGQLSKTNVGLANVDNTSDANKPISTATQAALDTRQSIVRWSGTAWGSRPSGAQFGVIFLSTNDAAAPAPPVTGLQVGDIWRKHPEAT